MYRSKVSHPPLPPPPLAPSSLTSRLAWGVACVVLWSVWGIAHSQFGPQCEEIMIPMCRKMPYNLTRLPNLLHHSTQENAQLAIEQFELLGWTKCSDQLEFFLCSMYAPICTVGFVSEAIPPCRSVCEAARRGCEPLLAKFNVPWPPTLACDDLPWYDRGVCITPQAIISDVTPGPRPPPTEASCQCRAQRQLLRQRKYNKAGFHYALRGTVRSVDTYGELTLTTVAVKKVVVAGRVAVVAGQDAHLWTNRSCACPPLVPTRDYLILGWEDFANSRLLYLEGSLALDFKKKYVRKIQRWEGGPPPPAASTPALRSPAPPPRQGENAYKRRRRKKRRRRRKKGKKEGRRRNSNGRMQQRTERHR